MVNDKFIDILVDTLNQQHEDQQPSSSSTISVEIKPTKKYKKAIIRIASRYQEFLLLEVFFTFLIVVATGEGVCLCRKAYEKYNANDGCTKYFCVSYDCSSITNFVGTTSRDTTICGRDTNFVHFFQNNGSFQAAVGNYQFQYTKDVRCVPQIAVRNVPVLFVFCAAEANESYLIEDVSGVPTALWQSIIGYEDTTDDDIEANNSVEVNCTNRNGCQNSNSPNCIGSPNCIDTAGSFIRSCNILNGQKTLILAPFIECDRSPHNWCN